MSLSHGKSCLRYSSVLFEKWGTTSFQTTTLNRTLEYLRHNFPLYRLISRQTDNPFPSYSQDLNPPEFFLKGYLKDKVCENNPQTRVDIIRKKSDGLHKKCSIELWAILLFELLLIHQRSAWNERSINYWKSIVKHYWF